jgi:hypothetical protein
MSCVRAGVEPLTRTAGASRVSVTQGFPGPRGRTAVTVCAPESDSESRPATTPANRQGRSESSEPGRDSGGLRSPGPGNCISVTVFSHGPSPGRSRRPSQAVGRPGPRPARRRAATARRGRTGNWAISELSSHRSHGHTIPTRSPPATQSPATRKPSSSD